MVWGDHENELVPRDGGARKRRVVQRPLDEAEFGLPGAHRVGGVGGVAHGQAQGDLRVGAAEGDEVARQPIARDGLAGVERQRPASHAAEVGEHKFGGLGPGEHGAGLDEEHAPRFGQFDPAANPVKQLRRVPPLDVGDRRADRRLDEVQRLGGPRHVLPLGHRHEDAKLVEGHGCRRSGARPRTCASTACATVSSRASSVRPVTT